MDGSHRTGISTFQKKGTRADPSTLHQPLRVWVVKLEKRVRLDCDVHPQLYFCGPTGSTDPQRAVFNQLVQTTFQWHWLKTEAKRHQRKDLVFG